MKGWNTLKVKGITSGTYLLKRIKNKNTKMSSKEICNQCKLKNTCKYRNISKFENGKVFDNNVGCEYFYFIITPKAILTVGRDTTTGKVMTKTFVGENETEAFNKALVEAGADALPLIQVEDLDAQKMLELSQRLERGEWIAIAADRVPIRGDKTQSVNFLGHYAEFPQGAWLLASILKAPLNTIFCLKEKGQYRMKLRRFSPPISGRGKAREENIKQVMQQYADLLAKECAENPLLWFNFYNFWNDKK